MKKIILPAVVALSGMLGLAGGSLINALQANAASTSGTNTSGSTSQAATSSDATSTGGTRDESKGGHTANGITETILTGDTATKAKAAAEAAVSGGTVLRVENDAEGATYEAHMTKSDGTRVTVKMDASFKVISVDTDSDHGPGGPGADSSSTSNTN